MSRTKHTLALYALLVSVLLNCVGLVGMRMLALQMDTVAALMIGYGFAAVPLVSKFYAGRPLLPDLKKDRWLIPMWGLSLFAVYYLFIGLPKLVTPSQVVLGLTLAPLTATFLSRDLGLKQAFTHHKLKIAPIALLFFLGLSEASARSNHSIWTFFLIWFLFSISQTAARKLSQNKIAFYAQSRMAAIVAIALFGFWIGQGAAPISLTTCAFGLFFGLILTVVFRFTLYGIRNTSPIESALLLSLNVPFSLTAEAMLLGRKITEQQIALATIYVGSVILIQYRMPVNIPVNPDTNSKS